VVERSSSLDEGPLKGLSARVAAPRGRTALRLRREIGLT
jgi:hypothetical protein